VAGDVIADVELRGADGEPVRLSTLNDRPLVIPLVRYYGCMPCRDYLVQLKAVRPVIEQRGARVIGVGRAADYQARHLMEHGIGFPLLLDPDQALYDQLDVRRIRWWKMLTPSTWVRYLRAARRARQGRITTHPLAAPGFVIIDPGLVVRFLYRGETLGDYPPIDTVLELLAVAPGT